MPDNFRYSNHNLDTGIGHVWYLNGSVIRRAVIQIVTVHFFLLLLFASLSAVEGIFTVGQALAKNRFIVHVIK